MIVALDYRPALFQAFGIGRYVRNLVPALLELDPGLRLTLAGVFLRGQKARTAAHAWPDPRRARYVGARLPARALPWLGAIGWSANSLLGPLDVFHDTDYATIPLRRGARVVTLYDTAYFEKHGFVSPAQAKKMLAIVRRQLRADPEIVTISDAAKADLVAAFDLDPRRVHVTRLGADPSFLRARTEAELDAVRRRFSLARPYAICAGTLEPRKNIVRLVKALGAARARGVDLDLILIGRRGHASEEIFTTIDGQGLTQHVRWLGVVSDDDAACLVRGASLLAFPTLHEGFGLPAIEGLAAGVPVVASDIPVLREVCGDLATLVDPLDERALSEAVALAHTDRAIRERAAAGPKWAASFTWRACAEGTRAAYQAAVERHA